MKISKLERHNLASQLGRLGGQATMKKYGKSHMKKLGLLSIKKKRALQKENNN